MKRITKEKILYFFIFLNPFLDLLSSLFQHFNFRYTPSTFLRPIIPLILIIYIFITDKEVRKKILFISLLYISYAGIHLYLYKDLITGVSYGGMTYELQYLCNYTYLIFTLLLFLYVFYKKKDNKLKDMILYNATFYIATIYLAIITGTSFSSYKEGIGYKGWFNTSGAVGSILVLSLFILIPYLVNKKSHIIYKISFLLLNLFYLLFLIGSRVGLYGSFLVVGIYSFITFIYYMVNNKKINFKKYLPLMIGGIFVVVMSFLIFGSYTFERREQLQHLDNSKIHVGTDIIKLKKEIDNNLVPKNYVSIEQKQAIYSLYDYANKIKLSSVDLRKQQLIYHSYLWRYQDSIALKLFGNGYINNFAPLTLEMEEIALFFNFGIFGFILYFVPFLIISFYSLYYGIKYIKKIDTTYIMYLAGVFVSYLISFLSGHTYFNTSVMPVIIILHLLLFNKVNDIKKEVKG